MSTNEPYSLPGQSAAANAQYAVSQTEGMDAAQKMIWFFDQVKTGGPMDFKNNPLYGDNQASQDFGNFNYAVVGRGS